MFFGPTLKGLAPPKMLCLERGRCLRHRLSTSRCESCFSVCAADAMSWNDDGLHWNENKCTGCLLCVASCPTSAITCSEHNISVLLKSIDEFDTPLLACSMKGQAKGHARIPCLGLLANTESLLVLRLALGRELKLNLTSCADCKNRRIVDALRITVDRMGRLACDLPGSVRLIDKDSELGFQEKQFSRRGFFGFLSIRSKQAGVSFVQRMQENPDGSVYGEKIVPQARRLLLRIINRSDGTSVRIGNLFPKRQVSTACDSCGSCPGVCPTGALEAPEKSDGAPSFNSTLCVACGLCAEICGQSAIALSAHDRAG